MHKILILFFFLAPATLLAQTGSIRGLVSDARTGEALVGANVIIVGSKPGYGAATDLNGMFLMTKIPPGEYKLQASYIDYRTATVYSVQVVAGHTAEANFMMRLEGDTGPVAEEPKPGSVAEKKVDAGIDSAAQSSAEAGKSMLPDDTLRDGGARNSSIRNDSPKD